MITDLNNGFDDDIVLGLVSTATGLEWEVSKTFSCSVVIPVACLDVDRYDAIGDCDEENGAVRCPRLGTRVTVNVLGGRDRMEIAPNTVPITDRIAFNGGEGSDVVHTGNGDDIINGGNGADFALFGGPGNDTISGGAGRDDLLGEGGDDTLNGGDDDDQIELGSGADTATGGGGNDLFDLATPTRDGRDDVNGGIGSDKATYTSVLFRTNTRLTAMRFIEANLETLAGQKDTDEGDVLRSIETYSGGADEDILTGVLSSNPSTYMGEGDEDTIFGSSGPNTLIGGASGDSMDGNAGNDVLDGKAGEGCVAIKDFLVDCGEGSQRPGRDRPQGRRSQVLRERRPLARRRGAPREAADPTARHAGQSGTRLLPAALPAPAEAQVRGFARAEARQGEDGAHALRRAARAHRSRDRAAGRAWRAGWAGGRSPS